MSLETSRIEKEAEESQNWYASGNYVIYPTTFYYKTWLMVLSAFYLVDFYLLSFTAAFNFTDISKFESNFFYVVQFMQMIQMGIVCFTAIRFSEVNDWTKEAIHREESDLFKKVGQIRRLQGRQEFCTNNKFITYNYMTTYFLIDLCALVPPLVFEGTNIHARLFCFFRLAKLHDIIDQLD